MFTRTRKAINVSARHFNTVMFLVTLTGVIALSANAAQAARLLMFVDDDCYACADFFDETESLYQRAAVSRDLPLLVLDLDNRHTQRKLRSAVREGRIDPIHRAFTFVLWDEGREVARLEGARSPERFVRNITHLAHRHGLSQDWNRGQNWRTADWRDDPDLTNRMSVKYKHPITRREPGTEIKIRW